MKGVPCYKLAKRPLGRIKNKHCWHCGKLIYAYIEGIDYPWVKDFCSWACSDAFDKRKSQMEKAHPEALEQMKESPYNHDDTHWAAYQNAALDSSSMGHIQFLAVGPQNTFKEKPKRYPDTQHGLGWRYLFIGWVDLETGEIKEEVKSEASTKQMP